jgi:hypothetical protein
LPVPVLRDFGINIQFSLSAVAILFIRYGNGLVEYAYEIIQYMARSLSMQKSIHNKITSVKQISKYQIG